MVFRLDNLLFDSKSNLRPQVEFEVAGAFDAFVSLEEIAPNLDWMEVLAESWGLPVPKLQSREKSPVILK
jgi:hypothetical protein